MDQLQVSLSGSNLHHSASYILISPSIPPSLIPHQLKKGRGRGSQLVAGLVHVWLRTITGANEVMSQQNGSRVVHHHNNTTQPTRSPLWVSLLFTTTDQWNFLPFGVGLQWLPDLFWRLEASVGTTANLTILSSSYREWVSSGFLTTHFLPPPPPLPWHHTHTLQYTVTLSSL